MTPRRQFTQLNARWAKRPIAAGGKRRESGTTGGATMNMPRVTETLPDSIRVRHPVKSEHDVQRDRVRASILAVPGEPSSREPAKKPALFNRIASR
jgi:hypothetical protein